MAQSEWVLVMNLAVLKKSRRSPRNGDIFVMLPPDGQFLYGRVINSEAKAGWGMDRSILIYVYRGRSKRKEDVPVLRPEDLLVAPMMTNRLPWSRGYFEFIKNEELQPSDVLRQHCFKDTRGFYYDDQNNELPGPVEPVGVRGLHSYRTIDDEVSRALGIPLATE
jgi:Immunity protein 26